MQELLHGAFVFALYLIPAAAIMLLARKFFNIPDELFRKILHFILLGTYFPFLFAFHTWWISVAFAAILIVIIYPLLALAGLIPAFSSFVNERKKGEFKSSFILALVTVMLSISICWGLFGDKLLTMTCVYAWGVGDAFAALIGKRFGKHKITWKWADHYKSIEGSAAMFITSSIAVACVLLSHNHLTLPAYIVIPVAGAITATVVEVVSKEGYDTVLCPAAAMAVMIPLMALFGGFV